MQNCLWFLRRANMEPSVHFRRANSEPSVHFRRANTETYYKYNVNLSKLDKVGPIDNRPSTD